MDQLLRLINSFPTIPFLFIGSGLTRRYYDLPSWRGLLEIFARRIQDDEFSYAGYENKAQRDLSELGLYPVIANLIENDFNDMWYESSNFRRLNPEYLEWVRRGASPFKAEIAQYIRDRANSISQYREEVDKFRTLSLKSISGIITTNYDTFLEDTTDGYSVYIGQEDLIFSQIYGVGEIYKIHGCINEPDSLLINEKDYRLFDENSSYLAAKLMTIFMEYPIVFLGYSISDANIITILKSIVKCLSNDKINKLADRFIFIEYDENLNGSTVQVDQHTMNFEGKLIPMKKVTLSNFGLLYDALLTKRSALPVKILRAFKQEVYDFVITNQPTTKMKVGHLDDSNIKDDDYVLAIGTRLELGKVGLIGLKGCDWYKNYFCNVFDYTADELLEITFPNLIKQNNKLPVHKYLTEAKGNYPECIKYAEENETFDAIIPASIKNSRDSVRIPARSVDDIWRHPNDTLERKTRLIACLQEEEIVLQELEQVISEIFSDYPNILEIKNDDGIKTNIRRLIRIYDYLKYGKKKP